MRISTIQLSTCNTDLINWQVLEYVCIFYDVSNKIKTNRTETFLKPINLELVVKQGIKRSTLAILSAVNYLFPSFAIDVRQINTMIIHVIITSVVKVSR